MPASASRRTSPLTVDCGRRLGRPPQRRLRVTTGSRIHQALQRGHQLRVHFPGAGPARSRPADPAVGLDALLQFPGSPAYRVRMNPGQRSHLLDPAPAQRPGLRPWQQPPLQLIQMRAHLCQHSREPILIHHQLSQTTTVDNRLGQTCLTSRIALRQDR